MNFAAFDSDKRTGIRATTTTAKMMEEMERDVIKSDMNNIPRVYISQTVAYDLEDVPAQIIIFHGVGVAVEPYEKDVLRQKTARKKIWLMITSV